jgi:hypothetical protein
VTAKRGQQPFFDHDLALPTCGDCRFFEARTGDHDRCAVDDEPVKVTDPGCEQYVTVRRGP